jgi:hypothetical protein
MGETNRLYGKQIRHCPNMVCIPAFTACGFALFFQFCANAARYLSHFQAMRKPHSVKVCVVNS